MKLVEIRPNIRVEINKPIYDKVYSAPFNKVSDYLSGYETTLHEYRYQIRLETHQRLLKCV